MIGASIRVSESNNALGLYDCLLYTSAEVLKNLNYIKDNTYELLKIICEYHDYGKVNLMFQKRIHSKGMRFDETKEVPHNLSLIHI